jgi:high-affinity Fe2+/Pb2+ permease
MTLALGWGLIGSIVFGLFVRRYTYEHNLKRPFLWQQTFLYELLFFTLPIPPRLTFFLCGLGALAWDI